MLQGNSLSYTGFTNLDHWPVVCSLSNDLAAGNMISYTNHFLTNKKEIMKKILFLAFVMFLASSAVFAQAKAGKQDTTTHTAFYSCPMHPEVQGHEPGKCPKCGMQLNISKKEEMKAGVAKNYTCPTHLDVSSSEATTCPKCGKMLALSGKEKMKAEVTKQYTCPMHADVASSKGGKCPKCGMKLTKMKKSQ